MGSYLGRSLPSASFYRSFLLGTGLAEHVTGCQYKWLGQEDGKGTTGFITMFIDQHCCKIPLLPV